MIFPEKVINPEDGLPEELFLRISSMMPIPNVDLFILNEKGELLLTWREDEYFGKGWHLPGGCIRFRETMIERVHKTAQNELGCDVRVDQEPIAIRDVIVNEYRDTLKDQDIRAHHLAVLYCCYPEVSWDEFSAGIKAESGWFSRIPDNILDVHNVYNDVFFKYGLMDSL